MFITNTSIWKKTYFQARKSPKYLQMSKFCHCPKGLLHELFDQNLFLCHEKTQVTQKFVHTCIAASVHRSCGNRQWDVGVSFESAAGVCSCLRSSIIHKLLKLNLVMGIPPSTFMSLLVALENYLSLLT